MTFTLLDLFALYLGGIFGMIIASVTKTKNNKLEKQFEEIPKWFKGLLTVFWPIMIIIIFGHYVYKKIKK
jgi:hypothetical protein